MADLAFPYLTDSFRRVMKKLGQGPDFQGQPTWDDGEKEDAANKAYDIACRELVAMDRDYQSQFEDVTISPNTTEYALPARTRFLRMAKILRSDGTTAGQRIRRASSDEMGFFGPNEAALLRPDRNSITFTLPTKGTLNVRLYYGVYYVPLLHGCARTGGGATMELADHSSIEDDLYNGLGIRLVAGTGIGQERTVSDYNGATQVATVSVAWATVPDDTTEYSSRPDLPWDMRDYYENLLAACLTEKLDETEAAKYRAFAAESLMRSKATIKEAERRDPDFTFDANMYGGWGDPGDPFN